MRDLKTYPEGGIHPSENKHFTNGVPIKNAPIPAFALIPMHQHLGSQAECLVKPGDVLEEGMLIGRATGFFSANVHSSIPGTVKEIIDIYMPQGIVSKAVKIELMGEFSRSGKEIKKLNWKEFSASQIIGIIKESGIVGLGGAAFPAHAKYSLKEGTRIETFVVNGVECEPFLTGDHRLMVEKSDEIIEGINIIRKIFSPSRTVIGIEANKPDAISKMERSIASLKQDIEVVPLAVKYPQGDEKMLLRAITGREVPSGKLPFEIGAVVTNVATVFAIYEAVAYARPLTERVVTVTGSIIRQPANLNSRIGTPIRELIEDCGGFTGKPERIIIGGPMMGFAVWDLETPVTKATSGIIALSRHEMHPGIESPCIQCGRCVSACPLGLSPTTLYKYIDHLEYDTAYDLGLFDCKECGCCGYVCPAHLSLVQAMKLGKLMYKKKEAKWKTILNR